MLIPEELQPMDVTIVEQTVIVGVWRGMKDIVMAEIHLLLVLEVKTKNHPLGLIGLEELH